VDALNPKRNPGQNPLFQVMFILQNSWDEGIAIPGLEITPLDVHTGTSKFDLLLSMQDGKHGLKGTLEYNTDLFEATSISRLVKHFCKLLEGVVTNSEQRVSDLPLLTESEKHKLLVEFNDTKTDYPNDKCVHELFEEQVEKTPDTIAVACQGNKITFKELNHKSNQLANYLVSHCNVKVETPIGICIDRSINMIIGLLGILKAGCCYVPLDPSLPVARLHFMLADAQLPFIITQRIHLQSFTNKTAQIIDIDDIDTLLKSHSCSTPPINIKSNNLAYILYTSGSTGTPKGVMIQHRSVINLLVSMSHILNYSNSSKDVFLALTTLSFDISVLEIFTPLCIGGQIDRKSVV